MTSEKMPLMLDNPMPVDINDVDDLFGDGVGLSLSGRAQSKQLQQRMDDIRIRGCCQAVAWSRTGSIANITPDGQNVELRYLRRSPEDGSWDLSEPTTCPFVKGTPTVPIVHLLWAGTSSPDLAVIDAAGRVTIVSFSISLNHPFPQRKWDADPTDDVHTVVGSYWLTVAPTNQQPYHVMYGPANKQGNGYTYENSFVHHGGPSHPTAAKSALLTITTHGVLRMFWSQANGRIEETTIELESISASDELITHAAFTSEKKYLLLALATTAKQLRLVKIEIQWGQAAQPDKAPGRLPGTLSPSLVEKHLATANWLQGGPGDSSLDTSMIELSHLEVLPSVLDNTGKNPSAPMVVTVRSRTPNEGSYQVAQTVFDRWEVIEQRQSLSSAWEQLGSRRNSISSELPPVTQMRKISNITSNKVVIAFHTINFGKTLVLAFADGTVEYRDRLTFDEMYTTQELDKIMNLRQVGWTFTDEGPCQQIAFSPTHCSMVQMGEDGKMKWNKLHYPHGDIGNSMQDAHYVGSIAALSVTAAPAMYYQNNYDDILAIVRPYTSKKRFVQDWVTELIRILKIQVDYSEDTHHDALVRNGSLQYCLSIMNALGFRGDFSPRSFQGKFSMLFLNVRNVVVLITIASNTPVTVREKLSPLDEPEVMGTLVGCAKWALDLIAWLMDSLFELMNDSHFQELLTRERFAEVAPYLHKKNNVALHFIMSSSSRGFLSAVCRRLAHLEGLSGRAIEFYRRQSAVVEGTGGGRAAPQLQQAYQAMQQVTSSALVKVSEVESLLTELSKEIRQAYQIFLPSFVKSQANPPQGKAIDVAIRSARVQIELAMLLSSTPPPAFLQIIKKFFTTDLRAFRNAIDPGRLFFADYDLLEVQDDEHSLAAKKARGMVYVDVFKRMQIRPSSEKHWRRCSRCTAVMEDIFGTRPGFSFVLAQQRKCSCGGQWTLLPKGHVA
ncbi:mediator complex, subunit Med16 [Fusarium flagelliforme]|uniref:Mediator of RNA polymerase II transcription subunit 16 n=1 Tax=Fusarium flagelliforme TaxID=2675880 RepID=A0A395MZN6_9HYPO|nr:mediator complex, subunit Med16 [Fusarium flagelliforme]KAH7196805.1 mediator complex, subunit Med16 [Fusarium flagelliforme]RFN53187.1 mediator of rna polymerase ii transcription subunit 16 [Fusarium flagelliforme]